MAISIPWLVKRGADAGRIGLAVGPDGLSVAVVGANGLLCNYQFLEQSSEGYELLADIVNQNSWQNIPCSMVLHPIYYQLLLSEAPAVAEEEVPLAVRWKTKELLDYPIEEAAVEYFMLPPDAYRGRQKMLYAAALRKTSLQSLVASVEGCGLTVDCIEIAELALHNIVSRLPSQPGGVALLQLYESESFINLVEDGEIYLSRRIDIGLDGVNAGGDNTQLFDSLYLEVQRSLDYYESQIGKGIITRLLYSPGLDSSAAIGDFLSAQLGLNVAALDLSSIAKADDVVGAGEAQMRLCAAAIGAALGPCQQPEVFSAAS
jgi:MSHA biogenesis protein MshI